MTDATWTAAIRLSEQGLKPAAIAGRLGISPQKVKRILITAGMYSTPRTEKIAAMQETGMTVEEIAEELGISEAAVQSNLPYIKGQYGAEYPTVNALRIRKSRSKNKRKETS